MYSPGAYPSNFNRAWLAQIILWSGPDCCAPSTAFSSTSANSDSLRRSERCTSSRSAFSVCSARAFCCNRVMLRRRSASLGNEV